MEKQVSKYEAELIDLIRKDAWPLFRALDSSLAKMPGYDHVPMEPGPLDADAIREYRGLIGTLMR